MPIKLTTKEFIKKAKKIHGNRYDYFKVKYRISSKEMEFLDYLKIPTEEKYRQVCINRKNVGGFDPKTNTIYEFLGDFWHGNPIKYDKNEIHPVIKKTYGELYKKTISRLKYFKKLGYNIKYIWESDWIDFKNKKSNQLLLQSI